MKRPDSATIRTVLLATGLAVAAACLGVTLWIRQLHDVEDAAARRELAGLSALLADHTDRTLQSVDLTLALLVGEIERMLTEGIPGPAALHQAMRLRLVGMPQIRSALVLDVEGRSVADATVPVPRAFNGADRAYFSVHRERADIGLFIGDPVRSRINGLGAISVSRRLNREDGSFAGVIVAAVDPDYFMDLYATATADPDAAVTLLKRDGMVLATTHAARNELLGASFAPGAQALVDAFTRSRRGFVAGAVERAGQERLAHFETARLYPLVILASRSRMGISSELAWSGRLAMGAGGVIIALALAIGWLLSRRLQSMESRFRDGIEAMPDGFLLWDANEQLVAWNSAYEKLLPEMVPALHPGVTLVDLVRWSIPRVRAGTASDDIENWVADRLQRYRHPSGPWELALRDGRIVELKESRTSDGGGVTLARDITEHRRHEVALEIALDAEREASLLQRRFVAMASHEFRTPLAIIDSAAQRVASHQAAADPGLGRRVAHIRGAVARLVALIDRTLSSSKLDAGQIELRPQALELGAMLRDLCAAQMLLSPGFEIALQLPEGEVLLEGDPALLEQVFTNLLSNAVKYSGRARRIEILVSASTRSAEIAIRDYGVGVAADEIGSLFSRFFRARTAMGISGTGIGLHLARELVAMHGGRIEVASALDHGSVFTVMLPRLAARRNHAAAA